MKFLIFIPSLLKHSYTVTCLEIKHYSYPVINDGVIESGFIISFAPSFMAEIK